MLAPRSQSYQGHQKLLLMLACLMGLHCASGLGGRPLEVVQQLRNSHTSSSDAYRGKASQLKPPPPITSRPLQQQHRRQQRKLSSIPLKSCYEDVLQLADAIPTMSMDMQPVMLSHARLNMAAATLEHLQCSDADKPPRPSALQITFPRSHTANQLKLKRLNSTEWDTARQACGVNVPGLAVVFGREPPLAHFGHRMLTDLPALFGLRTYLAEHGVDVSQVRVMFTDNMGLPAWGTDNFKRILLSLGYKSYKPWGHTGSTLCFERVIVLPHYFYPKWYTDDKGAMANMWHAPAKLYDTDPFHLKMIGQVRSAFGLAAELPFAPASNRTVVLASRDRQIRSKHGFRLTRILENEGELFKALQAIPGITVLQVELGAMPMEEVLRLLSRTSLLLGYHGAAFDNLVFLPRGASVLEILPNGTTHAPLYPTLAHRTGKEFARYVNDDAARQTCHKSGQVVRNCLNHHADLVVKVDEVVHLVKAMLQVQAAAMRRYSFDENI